MIMISLSPFYHLCELGNKLDAFLQKNVPTYIHSTSLTISSNIYKYDLAWNMTFIDRKYVQKYDICSDKASTSIINFGLRNKLQLQEPRFFFSRFMKLISKTELTTAMRDRNMKQ